ncbi:hypothetical protein MMPV_005971 [Pyropia vietnamensis]
MTSIGVGLDRCVSAPPSAAAAAAAAAASNATAASAWQERVLASGGGGGAPAAVGRVSAAKQAVAVAALRRRRAAACAAGTFAPAYDTVVPPRAARGQPRRGGPAGAGARAGAGAGQPAAGAAATTSPRRRGRRPDSGVLQPSSPRSENQPHAPLPAPPPPPSPPAVVGAAAEPSTAAAVEPPLAAEPLLLPSLPPSSLPANIGLDSLPVSPLSSSNEVELGLSSPPQAPAADAPTASAAAPADGESHLPPPPRPRRDPSLVLCPRTGWSLGGSIPPLEVVTPSSGDSGAAADAHAHAHVRAAAAPASPRRPVEAAMVTAVGQLPRGGGFVVVADHVARQPQSPLLAPPPRKAPAAAALAGGSRLDVPSPRGGATQRRSSGATAATTLPLSVPPPTSPVTLTADGWADLVDAATVEVTHVSDEEEVPVAEAARIRAAMGPMLPSGLALMGTLPRNLSVLPGVQDAVTPPPPRSPPPPSPGSPGRRQLPRGVPLRPVNRRRHRGGAPVGDDSGSSGDGDVTVSSSSTSPCASAGWATPPSPVAVFDGGSVCTASDGGGSAEAMSLPRPTVRTTRTDRLRRPPADTVRLGAGFDAPRPSLVTFASRRASVRMLHAAAAGGRGAPPAERRGLVGRTLRRLALLT